MLMKQNKGVCLFYTSITTDQIAEARSLGIKCVLARHKLSQWKSCLHVVMQTIEYMLLVLLGSTLASFSAVSGVDMKICRDQNKLTFLSHSFAVQF